MTTISWYHYSNIYISFTRFLLTKVFDVTATWGPCMSPTSSLPSWLTPHSVQMDQKGPIFLFELYSHGKWWKNIQIHNLCCWNYLNMLKISNGNFTCKAVKAFLVIGETFLLGNIRLFDLSNRDTTITNQLISESLISTGVMWQKIKQLKNKQISSWIKL